MLIIILNFYEMLKIWSHKDHTKQLKQAVLPTHN